MERLRSALGGLFRRRLGFEDSEMTVAEHLRELRYRIMVSVIALGLTTTVMLVLVYPTSGPGQYLFEEVLERPVRLAGKELYAIELTEIFFTYIRVALVAGLAFALPVIVYQTVLFVAPGLAKQERQLLFIFLPAATVLFLLGALFAYFVILPVGIPFLLGFGSNIAVIQVRIGDYVNKIAAITIWVGLSFQTPLIMYMLTRLGLVSPASLSRYRRYAVVSAFLVGAFITPTGDPLNQALVAIPIYVLYEIGVLLSRLAFRGRRGASRALVER